MIIIIFAFSFTLFFFVNIFSDLFVGKVFGEERSLKSRLVWSVVMAILTSLVVEFGF